MNLFRVIPQWLAGQLSEYVDNVDFDSLGVSAALRYAMQCLLEVGVFVQHTRWTILYSEP